MPKPQNAVLSVVHYLEAEGVPLNKQEEELIKALKNIKTEDELQQETLFNETYGKTKQQFLTKHKDFIQTLSQKRFLDNVDNNIKAFVGETNNFSLDIITLQRASQQLNNFNVYSDAELPAIQEKINDPFLSNYITVANQRVKAKIEANKTKGGYTVHTVNKEDNEDLFDAMLKKFRGKVVYVDFWATWCGPCKAGISKIAPLKEEMENTDVVFLYITNQTSPENTWKNAIADIKGNHYRVSAEEWDYLAKKFKIIGIPHYMLVNREGKVVRPKMVQNPNDRLKTILETEMRKN